MRTGPNPTAGSLLAGFVLCMFVSCGVWGAFAAILPRNVVVGGSGDDRRFAVRRRDARVYGFSIGGQISARLVSANDAYRPSAIENRFQVGDIRGMEPTLEQMARLLAKSGDYRVTSRLGALTEYHPTDTSPKLVAALADVETTGTNSDHDKIIELGVCLFEYDRQSGRIYKVLGSWGWLEDPGFSIPPEITKITGITDEMVTGHRIDDRAVNDLLGRVVLVIAHNADFDRRFLEKRLPAFASQHWACSRSDIDWKAEGIRSSALEFVAYSLGFFHDGHRAANDCRATLHAYVRCQAAFFDELGTKVI
jgi:Exonuclease